jgi:hypothetical protein
MCCHIILGRVGFVQYSSARDRVKANGANLSSHLKYHLRSRDTCVNKLNYILKLNGATAGSAQIPAGTSGTKYEILKTSGVDIREVSFDYKYAYAHTYIGGSNAHLGYLTVGHSTQYEPSRTDFIKLPVYMVYEGSQLVSCHSTAMDTEGNTLEDKICITTKGDNYIYNPSVYGCVLRSYVTASN